jgi:NodT family efflux transporter outer membrane factor (OMF) lipoprotein
MSKNHLIICTILTTFLTSCAVGPNYVRPPANVPSHFKEAPKGFKLANPRDAYDRGEWWKMFNDPYLNLLECKVNISNQNIIAAQQQYMQARALVAEARAAFFPTINMTETAIRQERSGGSSSTISGSQSLVFDASWEPDIWGAVRRSVEASVAGAESSAAQLAVTRLSTQASLAQFYFQLRNLDSDQQLLNNTVTQYKKAVKVTQNRYAAGVAAQADVLQAKSQLETAQAQAIANKINRATTEHAIAVLLGLAPAEFSVPFKPLTVAPPSIPLEIPSELLERRPDIASAERLMAQANAQIGVAISAFFPTLTLSATRSFLFPGTGWSLSSQVIGLILDGGFRSATVAAARATYYSNVALYRQTVLTAFQNVEDTLVSQRLLKIQHKVQLKAAADAEGALKIIVNQYKAGTVDYTTVITAQNTAFFAQRTAIDTGGLLMTTAVGLIKALGGGWDNCCIVNVEKV